VTRLPGQSTATYCAMLKENGELMFGIGDMDIHAKITPQYVCSGAYIFIYLNHVFHYFYVTYKIEQLLVYTEFILVRLCRKL
jgi:hypothetical protein